MALNKATFSGASTGCGLEPGGPPSCCHPQGQALFYEAIETAFCRGPSPQGFALRDSSGPSSVWSFDVPLLPPGFLCSSPLISGMGSPAFPHPSPYLHVAGRSPVGLLRSLSRQKEVIKANCTSPPDGLSSDSFRVHLPQSCHKCWPRLDLLGPSIALPFFLGLLFCL